MKQRLLSFAVVLATAVLLGACVLPYHHGRGGCPGPGAPCQQRCGRQKCCAAQGAPAEKPCEKPCDKPCDTPCPAEGSGRP